MTQLKYLPEQIAEVDVSNAIFDLPNPAAISVAEAKANVDAVIAMLSEDAPGHRVGLHLDSIGHPGLLSVLALLTKLSNSMP